MDVPNRLTPAEVVLMIGEQPQLASPMRLLEMLADRFGAFEAVANSTIKLARYAPADELSMDVQLAEAVWSLGAFCGKRPRRHWHGPNARLYQRKALVVRNY
jgi:hypothetical protein